MAQASPPQTSNWIKIIIALIGAGLLGQITGVWDKILHREESYRQLYMEEVSQNNKILDEIRQLKSDLTLLSVIDYEFPFPIWIKDLEGRNVYINKAYEEKILNPMDIPKIDYIGKSVKDFFPKDIVRQFERNDKQVIRTQQVLRVMEKVVINGEELYGITYKFPIFFNNKIQYIAGTWTEIFPNDISQIDKKWN